MPALPLLAQQSCPARWLAMLLVETCYAYSWLPQEPREPGCGVWAAAGGARRWRLPGGCGWVGGWTCGLHAAAAAVPPRSLPLLLMPQSPNDSCMCCAASMQGLAFDLKGLAACLEQLPRNQVLDTDAFSSDDEEVERAWSEEDAEGLPDLPSALPGARQRQQQPVPAAAASAARDAPQPRPHPAAAAAALSAAAVSAAAAGGEDVGDLLSELLGEKAAIGGPAGGSGTAQPQPAATATPAGRPQQAAAAPAAQQRPPAAALPQASRPVQQQAQRHAPQAASAAGADHDDELDLLLGLGAAGGGGDGATAAAGGVGAAAAQPPAKYQSLEDWLEGL